MSKDSTVRQKVTRGWSVLALLVAVSACGWNSGRRVQLTEAEKAWRAAHPVVLVAPVPDYAPLEWIDASGQVRGIAPEMLKVVEARSGLHFKYVKVATWQEALDRVKAGQADCVDLAAPTEDRQAYLSFTRSYLDSPDVVVVNDQWTGPTALEGFGGKRMAVVRGYAVTEWLRRKHPGITQIEVPDLLSALRLVSVGGADAMVVNLAPATYQIRVQRISNLRVVAESGYFYRVGFGVRKDAPELLGILDKTLATFTAEEVEAISRPWFDLHARWRPSPAQWAAMGGGLALVILGLALAWIRTLRTQVRERTEALQFQLAEQQRLEARQEAFVVMITHELRTPLTSVKGAMDLLAGVELDDAKKRELVRMSKANTDRLVELVNDLLDLERFAAGAVELALKAVAPAEVLKHAMEACQTYAAPLGVTIQLDPVDPQTPLCQADGRRLLQVLINLLSNALKHSPEGGIVHLRCFQAGEWIRLEVIDEGPGIPEALLPRLFEPFAQGELQGRGPKGTGLGLAISHVLVERHGGRIGVESKPQQGSTFYVLMPLAPGVGQS